MLCFSLKDLLVSTTLIAAGVAYIGWALNETADGWHLPEFVYIALWFGSGATIGAGVLYPFKKPWIGALIGAVAVLALAAYAMRGIPV